MSSLAYRLFVYWELGHFLINISKKKTNQNVRSSKVLRVQSNYYKNVFAKLNKNMVMKNIPLDLAIRHLVMMPYSNVNGIVHNADVPDSLPIAIPESGFDDEYPGH